MEIALIVIRCKKKFFFAAPTKYFLNADTGIVFHTKNVAFWPNEHFQSLSLCTYYIKTPFNFFFFVVQIFATFAPINISTKDIHLPFFCTKYRKCILHVIKICHGLFDTGCEKLLSKCIALNKIIAFLTSLFIMWHKCWKCQKSQ